MPSFFATRHTEGPYAQNIPSVKGTLNDLAYIDVLQSYSLQVHQVWQQRNIQKLEDETNADK